MFQPQIGNPRCAAHLCGKQDNTKQTDTTADEVANPANCQIEHASSNDGWSRVIILAYGGLSWTPSSPAPEIVNTKEL